MDHGAKPQNATYAYAVTPGVTPEELAAYAEDLPVEILANTATVQAVRRNDLGLTQAAFYGTGEIWIDEQTRLAVSQPCVLMVRQVDGDWSITAADPRQGTKPIAIDVNRQLTGPGATWNEQTQTTRILFTVPTGANAGASATQTYSLTPSPTPLIGEGEFTEDFGSLAGAPNAFRAMTGPEGSSPENKTSPAVPLWAFQTAKGASGGAGPGAASNATDKESLASAADQYFAQLAGGRQVVNPLQFEENTISFLV